MRGTKRRIILEGDISIGRYSAQVYDCHRGKEPKVRPYLLAHKIIIIIIIIVILIITMMIIISS